MQERSNVYRNISAFDGYPLPCPLILTEVECGSHQSYGKRWAAAGKGH